MHLPTAERPKKVTRPAHAANPYDRLQVCLERFSKEGPSGCTVFENGKLLKTFGTRGTRGKWVELIHYSMIPCFWCTACRQMQPTVITAEKLSAQLDGETPPLVAQVTTAEAYHAGHVPGAVHVEPSDLVSGIPPASGRLPSRARLTTVFRGMGYSHDRTVVTLDDEGGGWAGRLAWTLDIIGNTNWRYLDGGLRAWQAAGLPLTRAPTPVTPTTVDITIDAGPIAEAEDILGHMDDPDLVIWDCRSRAEFEGRRRAAKRAGHIPGAVNLDWLDVMDRDRDLRLVEDPRALLARHGVLPERDVITHCQTHHRSGLTYMVARLLGFPRIRAYHGSWSEWGNREDTPVE